MGNALRVCQTSFTVSDLDRSLAFYRDVLGMTVHRKAESQGSHVSTMTGFQNAHMRLVILKCGEHDVELIQYVAPAGERRTPQRCDVGAAHMAFEADDIDQVYQALSRQGVRFVSPPQRSGNVKACYFLDPDGITLELLQHGVTGQ